jgi:predicted NBD/HSP70 family sugar kinase
VASFRKRLKQAKQCATIEEQNKGKTRAASTRAKISMFLGLDISQVDAAAILAKENGETQIALRSALPKEGGSPAVWMCALELAREAMQRASLAPEQVRAAALSMEVPFDARGVIRRGARTDGWEGFDAPRALSEHLNIARAVAENRAFCAARGEARFGALRGEIVTQESTASTREDGGANGRGANWLFLHLDAQLGAAACMNGNMLRGENHRALDLGAVCIDRDGALGASGSRGSLEAYCGGESFVSRAAGYGITVRSALEVWQMAPQNYAAQTLCDDFVRRLAQGISVALAVLDARRIVFGGAISDELGETLLTPLHLALSEFWRTQQEGASTRAPVLEVAQLGRDAAVLGAVDLAISAAQNAR